MRITTGLGYFVIRAWRTEGIRPGVVGASHHMGRWRLEPTGGAQRWSSGQAGISDPTGRAFGAGGTGAAGRWSLRQQRGVEPFTSDDPDSERVWWTDAGVHQNLTFPVQPDPVSGMHCWLQRVTVGPAAADDRYGDVVVDTDRSTDALPGVAGQGPAGPRSRRPPPPAVAGPPGQAGGHGLPRADHVGRRRLAVRSVVGVGRPSAVPGRRSASPFMADRAATVAARSAANVEGGRRGRDGAKVGGSRAAGRAGLTVVPTFLTVRVRGHVTDVVGVPPARTPMGAAPRR